MHVLWAFDSSVSLSLRMEACCGGRTFSSASVLVFPLL